MTHPALAAALALATVAATASGALYLLSDDDAPTYYAAAEPGSGDDVRDFSDDPSVSAKDPLSPFYEDYSKDTSANPRTVVYPNYKDGTSFTSLQSQTDSWVPNAPTAPGTDATYRNSQVGDTDTAAEAPADDDDAAAQDPSDGADVERAVADALATPPPLPTLPVLQELPSPDPNQDLVTVPDVLPCRSPSAVPDPASCDLLGLTPSGDPTGSLPAPGSLVPNTDGILLDVLAAVDGALFSVGA